MTNDCWFHVCVGIDTTHVEFAAVLDVNGKAQREVKNIYNVFDNDPKNPAADCDDVGHGTHVAG